MPVTDVGDVFGNVAMALEESRQCEWQLGVDEKAHGGSAGNEYRVVSLGCGVIEACLNVGGLEIGKVFENFRLGHIRGEEVEHVLHPDAHPTDAGTASTLVGIEGNAIIHWRRLADACSSVKRVLGDDD